jgi:hypothetical protein
MIRKSLSTPKPRQMNIWSPTVYNFMYSELVSRFGAHNEWEAETYPSQAQKAEYDQFCADMASLVGATSADAVKQQVSLAIGKREWSPKRGFTITVMKNIVAAYQCGFINLSYVPSVLVAQY